MQDEISFGVWLRKQRRALDLTRQALADQIGCAEVTLRRIEAGTLKPSKELAGILIEKLDIPETERPQWISFARGLSTFPSQSIPSSNKPLTNLPAPLTTFIGREKEQVQVINLINKHRLLTLTGSGGVGKTRFARKVGERLLENYADGIWLVELASLNDPRLVPQTAAIPFGLITQSGVSYTDLLINFLRTKYILLLLDNCEHLLDACAHLADTLLKNCPNLKILVTSREPLEIAGEALYRVPSLGLPDLQYQLDTLRNCESVRLFEERAQLLQFDFSLTPENAASVVQICHRLDGVPLAIELAAAKVGVLSTEQIAKQLDESFNVLTGGSRIALPRHQTLRATIEWSYDFLAEKECLLFRRLAVFMSGWTLEAMEQVCVGDGIESNELLNLLSQLVDKSLVLVEIMEDENRYRMLETIRQFACKKLTESGEEKQFRGKHLDYFLQWAETAQPHLYSQLVWLKRIEAEHNNVRTALQWAAELGTGELGLRLVTALGSLWVECGHVAEGWGWFESLLRSRDSLPIALQAKALKVAGNLAGMQGHYPLAQVMLRESVQLFRVLGEKLDTASALNTLGLINISLGDHLEAKLAFEESLELYQESEMVGKALALLRLGTVMYLQGDYRGAQALCEESLALAQKEDNRLLMAWVFKHLGNLAQRQGHAGKAVELLKRSLALFQEFRHILGLIAYLEGIAEVAGLKGEQERLVRLFATAAEFHTKLGIMPFPAEQVEYERQLAIAHTQLGPSFFEIAWEAGRRMSLDEAVTYALKELQ